MPSAAAIPLRKLGKSAVHPRPGSGGSARRAPHLTARADPGTGGDVASNTADLDRVRLTRALERTKPMEAAADIADSAPLAIVGLESADEARRLQACLDALDAKQADAIRTAFFDGVTYEALANRLGAPLGTVKSWIRRGLAGLKACLST
eukprot:gene16019-16187_t